MLKDLEMHTPETCLPEASIMEVAQQLREQQHRHLFVVNEEQEPVGVIGATDILFKAVAEGKNPAELKVKDLMSTPVDVADIEQEVEFAMKIMMERKTYSCLVTEKGKVKGVVGYKEVMERLVKKLHNDGN